MVDDYAPWRSLAASLLEEEPGLRIVGEAADGLEAVQIAQQLQPDLILLDIGLPTLNGISAARRIKEVSPGSKILFVSENRSRDIAEEALRTGAHGYVVKSAAQRELSAAVEAVLQGKQFVSGSLTGPAFGDPENEHTANHRRLGRVANARLSNVEAIRRHEVVFYSDDRRLLHEATQFIGAALRAGNAAIVVATEPHRESLLSQLQGQGVDVGVAIKHGRYLSLEATDALSPFMVDDALDAVRFMESFGNLIEMATKAAVSEHPRVAVFGEGSHLLWLQGKTRAALEDEKLCNQLTRLYDVDILCAYSADRVQSRMNDHDFQQICAEHSAVYSC